MLYACVFGPSLLSLAPLTSEGALATLRDDTFVSKNNNGRILGERGRFSVKSSPSGGDPHKAYLRFELSSTLQGSGTTPSSTALELTFSQRNSASNFSPGLTLDLWGITDGVTGDNLSDWNESNLTWNNSSANAQNNPDVDHTGQVPGGDPFTNASLLGSFSLENGYTQGQKVRFSGSEFTNFIDNDTNEYVTFALSYGGEASGEESTFYSKENQTQGARAARIVPEPTNAIIGVMLASGLLFRRRSC